MSKKNEEDKKKEDILSGRICNSLKEMMEKNKDFQYNVSVESKKQIFIGTTCGVSENKGNKVVNLFFQSAEQDIVVYLKKDKERYKFEGKDFFKKYTGSFPDNKMLIPLIIFEVKCESKNVTTHAIRHYSEIARMVKNIFPFCMYNLLLVNVKSKRNNRAPDRIYMSSKYFDKVIRKEHYTEENASELNEAIFEIVKERLKYLKNEDHFGFRELL